jgi:hypothetical protein
MIVLGYVLYHKKVFCHEQHIAHELFYYDRGCETGYGGGGGKLKMRNKKIYQTIGQNLLPTADKTKRNTQNLNTVEEYKTYEDVLYSLVICRMQLLFVVKLFSGDKSS